MLKFLTLAALLPAALASLPAAASPAHGKVEASALATPAGMTLSFKVVPEGGLHINEEGPWQLELTPSKDLAFAKTTWKKDSVDFALPGFKATTTAAPATAAGQVSYKLTAFVCTDDKKQCYRDVLTGQLGWKR